MKNVNEELERIKQSIIELNNLGDNWDDEGGIAIDKNQIDKAILFVAEQYKLNNNIPYFIAPSVNSGVLVVYKNNNIRIDIIFEDRNPYMAIFNDHILKYQGTIKNIDYELVNI